MYEIRQFNLVLQEVIVDNLVYKIPKDMIPIFHEFIFYFDQINFNDE